MNVKKGDLAIIIASKSLPEVIGRIVEVEEFLGDGENRWGCHCQTPVMIDHPHLPGRVATNKLSCRDADLRPVSGLPDEDDVDTEITKPTEELETA